MPVQVEELRVSALIEPECLLDDCLQVDELLVRVNKDSLATLLIISNGNYVIMSGAELVQAYEVNLGLRDYTSADIYLSCRQN